MKKQILLLAAGLLCAACTKEMAPDDNVSGDRFVLRASLEQDKSDGKTDSGEEGEKTTLNEDTGAVLWAEGDKIKAVWNGGSAESVGLSTGAVAYAEFSFESMGGTPAYVVYPSSVTSTWDGTDFKVTFPSTQGGTFSEASLEAGPVDVVGRRISSGFRSDGPIERGRRLAVFEMEEADFRRPPHHLSFSPARCISYDDQELCRVGHFGLGYGQRDRNKSRADIC